MNAITKWVCETVSMIGLVFLCCALPRLPAKAGEPSRDVYSQDAARFRKLLASPAAARRIEGIQGLDHLKYWPAEDEVLELLSDPSPTVQREALLALRRLGTARSVPQLIRTLGQPDWAMREDAWLSLCHLTGQHFAADQKAGWEQWWKATALTNQEAVLLATAHSGEPKARHEALRALSHLATSPSEARLIGLLHQPGLTVAERDFVAEALEHAGTAKAIPALAGYLAEASAWALGQMGGPDAEKALLQFPKSLGVLINLDRLGSTNAGPLIPQMVGQMGLITYRGQPDDLMNADPQPIQAVGANLIRRSGLAPLLVELVLQELEDSMKPALPHGPRPTAPPGWTPMLTRMRAELKPGFVRDDGATSSQPLTALLHVAEDPALSRRLVPLLRHPAFVPRVYAALTLGKLKATNALPEMLALVREGYPFSDAVALASGKHFDQSQTVRWRGFICMALGRLGGEEARRALEQFAADGTQPRDIRYGAVVGLGFIGSPDSEPVLRQVATQDIIWMVRDEARRATANLEVLSKERSP
jgi:HEAT repeat protein